MDTVEKVIFGGTFDPVHEGHIGVVRILAELYREAIVMPAFVSPFKDGACASAEDRLVMLRIAFRGMPNVSVSDYEIAKGGVSYTSDMLRAHPDCAFCVGGDSMETLATWHDASFLLTREIAVVEREGCRSAEDAVRAWNARGGNARIVGSQRAVSSSEIRLRLGLGLECPQLPPAVRAYIDAHGLYGEWSDAIALLRTYGLGEKRIAHTQRVALTAQKLALRYGVEADLAIEAALLHDIAKALDEARCAELGLRVGPEVAAMAPPVRHAALGAAVAEQLLGRSPEIVDAIRWHTTGKPDMPLLTEIVCLADYIEPGRVFDGVDGIRVLAETDLHAATLAMLENTVAYLRANRTAIEPITLDALDWYRAAQKREGQ